MPIQDEGADVDTAHIGIDLMRAAKNGNAACVTRLLDAGADAAVNAADQYGITALICAAFNGHVDCVEALIKAGADVHAVLEGGETALMCAAEKGHVDCVEALLAAGAALGVDVADGDGKTPLLEGLARDETGGSQARQSSELLDSAKPVVLPVGASGASDSANQSSKSIQPEAVRSNGRK